MMQSKYWWLWHRRNQLHDRAALNSLIIIGSVADETMGEKLRVT